MLRISKKENMHQHGWFDGEQCYLFCTGTVWYKEKLKNLYGTCPVAYIKN